MVKINRLDELKALVDGQGGEGHEGEHGGHHESKPAHYPPSFLAGLNPVEADYERPDSTQGMDYIPENVNKRMLPVYAPVSANDTMPALGNKPVHSAKWLTRKDWLNDQLVDEKGGLAATYRFYFWAWVFLAATIASALWVNIYLAGIFAWLAGHNYSQAETNTFWTKLWWTTKPLTYTP